MSGRAGSFMCTALRRIVRSLVDLAPLGNTCRQTERFPPAVGLLCKIPFPVLLRDRHDPRRDKRTTGTPSGLCDPEVAFEAARHCAPGSVRRLDVGESTGGRDGCWSDEMVSRASAQPQDSFALHPRSHSRARSAARTIASVSLCLAGKSAVRGAASGSGRGDLNAGR